MVTKIYKTTTEMFFYKRYKTIDLFNKKEFPTKKRLVWMEIIPGCKREVEAMRKARDVFNVFLEMLVEDLLEGHYFVFPLRKFGFLKITDKTDYERDDYIYDIETRGRFFKPALFLDRRVVTSHRRRYIFRFNSILRKKLYELVTNGKLYT